MGEAIAGAVLLGACFAVIITVMVNGAQTVAAAVRERARKGHK